MKDYVFIETYGCSANLNNSEIMKGILKQSGYEITCNIDISEIIILNSCIVKGKTENKIKRRIQDLTNSKKLVVVTGCMPETDFKQLQTLNSNVLLLGTHHFKDIVKLINDFKNNKLSIEKQKFYVSKTNEIKLNSPKIPSNKLISITQISEGCLGNCSYCKVKFAKKDLFSYDIKTILKSIENDLKNGAKEVWITSQDNAAFGIDKYDKPMLPDLLKKIFSLKHNFKLRLGMMNPNFLYPILDEMVEIFKNKKIYKFLHVPVQSASNNVLKVMNRNYDVKIVKEIFTSFRKEFPDITIATDIIIGFPNESDKDFLESLDFVKNFKPDVFNLSKFSPHKGTRAEKMQVLPINVINNRTSKIMSLHKKTALLNKQKFLGRKITVFINLKKQGFFEARDENYNIVLINSKDNVLGKNLKVVITQVGVHHLIGEII